jgi:hypothetical protein
MQEALRARGKDAVGANPLRVRMGLHWGTAVVDGKDLYGDAVNTAARVEALADGDEILISGQLAQKILAAGIASVFFGTELVKGKEEKVDIHCVNWQGLDASAASSEWRRRRESASAAGTGPSPSKPGVRIIGPPDPQTELSSVKPAPAHGNPYFNRVMVAHPDMFFGRAALVHRLMSRLSAQPPQSISIVGERRIGKSSLLNHLRSPKSRLHHLENPGSFLFLYVDFQQLRAGGPDQFHSLLFTEMRRQCGSCVQIDLPADSSGLRVLCETAADAGLRIVFLFDEFEVVTKSTRMQPEFYSFLRSLANSLPVSYVTASGRALKDMCASHEISDSPFFNIFSIQPLGLLSRREAESLVREPSASRGIPLAPVADSILSMGGCYPCFLQIAACAWYEHLETEGKPAEDFVGAPPPREVLDAFHQEAWPHFEFALETMPDPERETLRRIATGAKPDQAHPATRELERKGYLAREGEDLVPFSTEFLQFLRTTLE